MNSYITNLYPNPSGTSNDHRLTVDSTAGGVQFSQSSKDDNTDAFDSLTKFISFDVQNADCFVTFDTSAPTTSNGHRLYAGRSYTISKAAAERAKFIKAGTTDSVIHASQFSN